MLLFLAFASRSVERSERSSQFSNKHWRLSSLAELLRHFISLTFDLIKVILEVALRQDYRECKFFFRFADSITSFKKLIRKKVSHLTYILIKVTFPSTNQHRSLYFFLFQTSSNAHQDALENVFAQGEIIFTHRLTLDESNSCPSRPTVLYV